MQFQFLMADFILIIHFVIVIYIASWILLIPIAYKINWDIFKNKNLRLIHIILLFFVSLESIFGLTCPLTSIENYLRNIVNTKTFISYWLETIIYWDLPNIFFVGLYSLSLMLTIFWWKLFPPKKSLKKKKD